jgi:hypothetical protein
MRIRLDYNNVMVCIVSHIEVAEKIIAILCDDYYSYEGFSTTEVE